MGGAVVGAVIIVVFLFIYGAAAVRIVRPWEKGLIERLGKSEAYWAAASVRQAMPRRTGLPRR